MLVESSNSSVRPEALRTDQQVVSPETQDEEPEPSSRYAAFVEITKVRHEAYGGNDIFNHRPDYRGVDMLPTQAERTEGYKRREQYARVEDDKMRAAVSQALDSAGDSPQERLNVMRRCQRVKSLDIIDLQVLQSREDLELLRVLACQALQPEDQRGATHPVGLELSICVDGSVVPEGEAIITATRQLARQDFADSIDMNGDGARPYYLAVAERVSYALSFEDIPDKEVQQDLHALQQEGFVYDPSIVELLRQLVTFQHEALRPISVSLYAYRHEHEDADDITPVLSQSAA